MGLVHTPRVIASLANGLWKKRSMPDQVGRLGLGPDNVYRYRSSPGLFDIDYLGHMNNAAYLSHAEYARWELTAINGMLSTMYRDNIHFVVTGTHIRYRQELAPYKSFQVDTFVAGLDEKTMWILHNFRYPNDRTRAQMIVQGVAVQKGKVVDPRRFFVESVGADAALVEQLSVADGEGTVHDLLERYRDLEAAVRQAASDDDKKYTKK